jgi:hypothetical protein
MAGGEMITTDLQTQTTGRRVYYQNKEESPNINIAATATYVSIYSVLKTEQDYKEAKEILEAAYQKHLELKG